MVWKTFVYVFYFVALKTNCSHATSSLSVFWSYGFVHQLLLDIVAVATCLTLGWGMTIFMLNTL